MTNHQAASSNMGNVAMATRYSSQGSSPYHGLVRELLNHSSSDMNAPVVGITSAAHRSGVTTIASMLGVSAADIVARPALLIDCNAKAPDLLNLFNVPVTGGLKEIVANEQALDDCVYQTHIDNLQIVGPGDANCERSRSNETQGWSELLTAAREEFGFVVVDLPPVPDLLSQVTWLRGIDHLLLVVEAERTRRQAVGRAKNQLQRVGVELSGIVLNKRRKHIPGWLYRRI